MENWKESSTLFVWVVYILFTVILISVFVIFLIRRSLLQESHRKKEVSLLEERHLRNLLDRHIHTQEYERERIGSDLHDAISNKLNMILLKLRVNADTNDIEEDINETINTVRRIAHDLNPPLIDKMPLDVLVMAQFDRLSPQYEVLKWSQYTAETKWKTSHKIQVIRIVQELVNNIVKHSEANSVSIMIRERKKGCLSMIVEDDGVGFAADKQGMGLENIENRLFIIGGVFKVKSKQNKGTRVVIVLNNGI